MSSAFEVVFHRLAAGEYRAARAWYASRSHDVAKRFCLAMDRAVDQIATRAETLPTLLGPHHYVRAGRFPYLLIFRVIDTRTVIVLAVAHTSRRPGYWRHRV